MFSVYDVGFTNYINRILHYLAFNINLYQTSSRKLNIVVT